MWGKLNPEETQTIQNRVQEEDADVGVDAGMKVSEIPGEFSSCRGYRLIIGILRELSTTMQDFCNVPCTGQWMSW